MNLTTRGRSSTRGSGPLPDRQQRNAVERCINRLEQ
jgi:hypothetical protein